MPIRMSSPITWSGWRLSSVSALRIEQQVQGIVDQPETHAEQIADLSEQVGELHSRLEGNEEVSRMLAEVVVRLGP